jgi:hypothetical protein
MGMIKSQDNLTGILHLIGTCNERPGDRDRIRDYLNIRAYDERSPAYAQKIADRAAVEQEKDNG